MIKCKLGELLDVRRGASLSGKYYATKGKLVRLTLGNFNYPNGGFKENTTKEDIFFTGNVRPEFILKEGDIITPLTEQVAGLLGETARIPESNKYIQSGDIGLIIPDETKLNKLFAYFLVSSPIVKKQLGAAAQQTKIRHTSPDKIKDCEVWIPDLKYQERAGRILDNINNKIANNNKIILESEEMAKTIYDYWFLQYEFPNEEGKPYKSSGGKMVYNEELKKEIPEGWAIKRFKDITDMYQPKTISTNSLKANGKYNVYGANGIIGKYDEYNHEQNEIAVCCRGAACGEYLMTLPFSWITGNAMVIKPKDNNYKEYIFYKLSDKDIFNYITGSAQPQITRTNIENMKIIIPNSLVLEKFNNIGINLRNQIIMFMQENEELTKLRDELLPLLMNGQINVDNIEI